MSEPSPSTGVSVAPGVSLPESALVFTFARSGGPGGQNVNKVSSKATLTLTLADLRSAMPPWALARLAIVAPRYFATDRLVISSDENRSQSINKAEALRKLREVLVQAMHRPKIRRKTKPSYGSVQRRLESKKAHSHKKADRRDFHH